MKRALQVLSTYEMSWFCFCGDAGACGGVWGESVCDERVPLRVGDVPDGVRVLVLMLLSVEDEGSVLVAREPLLRLLRPLLLRALGLVPGVPRAQTQGI